MDKYEEYVVGISQTDYECLDEQALSNKDLKDIFYQLNDNSRWSNKVRVLEDSIFDSLLGGGARGSVERAQLLRTCFAHHYKLPIETFHIYKETVNVELIE